MPLPKDLEAKRDEYLMSRRGLSSPSSAYEYGAQAVLDHEMIKKLEEALKRECYCVKFPGECEVCEALAEFRAWRDSK